MKSLCDYGNSWITFLRVFWMMYWSRATLICIHSNENMQKIFVTTEHEKLHTIYPDKLLLMHSQVLCIYNTQKPYGSWEMAKKSCFRVENRSEFNGAQWHLHFSSNESCLASRWKKWNVYSHFFILNNFDIQNQFGGLRKKCRLTSELEATISRNKSEC